jgi:hypothetical protein
MGVSSCHHYTDSSVVNKTYYGIFKRKAWEVFQVIGECPGQHDFGVVI